MQWSNRRLWRVLPSYPLPQDSIMPATPAQVCQVDRTDEFETSSTSSCSKLGEGSLQVNSRNFGTAHSKHSEIATCSSYRTVLGDPPADPSTARVPVIRTSGLATAGSSEYADVVMRHPVEYPSNVTVSQTDHSCHTPQPSTPLPHPQDKRHTALANSDHKMCAAHKDSSMSHGSFGSSSSSSASSTSPANVSGSCPKSHSQPQCILKSSPILTAAVFLATARAANEGLLASRGYRGGLPRAAAHTGPQAVLPPAPPPPLLPSRHEQESPHVHCQAVSARQATDRLSPGRLNPGSCSCPSLPARRKQHKQLGQKQTQLQGGCSNLCFQPPSTTAQQSTPRTGNASSCYSQHYVRHKPAAPGMTASAAAIYSTVSSCIEQAILQDARSREGSAASHPDGVAPTEAAVLQYCSSDKAQNLHRIHRWASGVVALMCSHNQLTPKHNAAQDGQMRILLYVRRPAKPPPTAWQQLKLAVRTPCAWIQRTWTREGRALAQLQHEVC